MHPPNTSVPRVVCLSAALLATACSGRQPSDIEGNVTPVADSGEDDAATSAPDVQGPGDAATPIDDAVTTPDTSPMPDGSTTPGCGEPPTEPSTPMPTTAPDDRWPMLRHWERPKVDKNNVALTFDDGPNPSTTNAILDALKAKGIRATFFLNSRTTGDLRTDAAMQQTLQRVVAEGHWIGNHTASHYDLRLASVDVDAQLRMLEEDVKLAAPCAPPLTLVRAPFGEPYLSSSDAEVERIAPIIARHGVHVAWAIETRDFTCKSAACVVERVLKWIDMGRRGTILLHDTEPHTAEALPTILDELEKRGVTFTTVERLIREKYGKSSAELLAEWKATH